LGGNRAAAEATLATSLRFSLGERAKKIPTDKSWDFEYWWGGGNRTRDLQSRFSVGHSPFYIRSDFCKYPQKYPQRDRITPDVIIPSLLLKGCVDNLDIKILALLVIRTNSA